MHATTTTLVRTFDGERQSLYRLTPPVNCLGRELEYVLVSHNIYRSHREDWEPETMVFACDQDGEPELTYELDRFPGVHMDHREALDSFLNNPSLQKESSRG